MISPQSMIQDPEKADLEVSQHVSQDLDGAAHHPEISTAKDELTSKNDLKKDSTDEDSINSHSSVGSIQPLPTKEDEPKRSKSKSSSVRSTALSIIPRSQRRGLFARFAIIPEVERPYEYKRSTKWLITLIVALAAAAAPLGSAIFFRKYIQPASFVPYLPKLSYREHESVY